MSDRIREATVRGARWLTTTAPNTPIATVDLDQLAMDTAWVLTPRRHGDHGPVARREYESVRASIRAALPTPSAGELRAAYAQRLHTARTAVSA